MFQTANVSDLIALEAILNAEEQSDDVLDNCECVSLSGIGTEAQHDLCRDYTTEGWGG